VLREYFGTKLVTEMDNETVPYDPYPVALPIFQQRVVRVLEAALAERGHRVEWSTRLVTFAMDDDGVTVEVIATEPGKRSGRRGSSAARVGTARSARRLPPSSPAKR